MNRTEIFSEWKTGNSTFIFASQFGILRVYFHFFFEKVYFTFIFRNFYTFLFLSKSFICELKCDKKAAFTVAWQVNMSCYAVGIYFCINELCAAHSTAQHSTTQLSIKKLDKM